MTTTATAGTAPPGTAQQGRAQQGEARTALQPDSRRTLQALLAVGLGILPLCQMFTDTGWLIDAWLTMAIVLAPAALLRMRWEPSALHIWIGLLLAVLWLTARFVPTHAIAGFIPGPGAWHQVADLSAQLHDTINNGVAPIHTTVAVRVALCALLALLAALVDLVGVVARRGALAGVPLLVVYTVSGAVPRHTVGWPLFIGAAAGFLLLLGLDANDDVRSWGRFMPRAGATRPVSALAVSGQRIAVIAIVVAVVVPVIAPSKPTNLIANAFHNGGSTGIDTGLGSGISLDPLASLKGNLTKPKATKLFTVTLSSTPAQAPFYLRANTLEQYTSKGWVLAPGNHGDTVPVDTANFAPDPAPLRTAPSTDYTATIKINALAGSPPVFNQPAAIRGLSDAATWSSADQLVLGTTVHKGDEYVEDVAQPSPTVAGLQASRGTSPELAQSLTVPSSMPASVVNLVKRLTGSLTTPYAKTIAIYDYFTNPANGFVYSLNTKLGDSGSDLVDFLTNKQGFCQQYAAAMGIMLRIAGVPARVVLGYTHPAPDSSNTFTVTTADAHAWVEAYFTDGGWVSFDPTPLAGIDGGAQAELPYAPHPSGSAVASDQPSAGDTVKAHPTTDLSTGPGATPVTAATVAGHHGDLWPAVWVILATLLVLGLILLPAWVRWRRRHRRLRRAQLGDPDPLWAELSATAIDLGYVWSPARTPRQVADWLGRQGGSRAGSLLELAAAVESARYAAPASGDVVVTGGAALDSRSFNSAVLVERLLAVEAGLRADRSRTTRLRSRLLPASLGWRWLRVPRLRRR
jgi:transglutaminase-like putative cysteine protease